MDKEQVAFEKSIDGKEVHLFNLSNDKGIRATITNYGARLVSLFVPDADGHDINVSIGFDSIDGYLNSTEPYYGATIGRFANRIAEGKFSLDGANYHVLPNNGKNALHGGKNGFQSVVWDAEQLNSSTLQLSYQSKDMEEGFPGNLEVRVTFELTADNGLKISYQASTDKTTVLNLTNHAYFNLNGEGSGSVLKHLVQINADEYTPIDTGSIPLGALATVEGTPFDFTKPISVGARIEAKNEQLENGRGYDHNFVLNPHGPLQPVAIAVADQTKIKMEVFTDQPGLQFYTGNFMESKNVLKGNYKDDFRTAFCMETQHFPDSPNQSSYPTTLLKPGEVFQSFSMYRFSINS
jgi:aldose 1-epimerase